MSAQVDGIEGEWPYKLLLVALSICSSRAVLAEDDHQLIIVATTGNRLRGKISNERAGQACYVSNEEPVCAR
jgi:hypothetical protein